MKKILQAFLVLFLVVLSITTNPSSASATQEPVYVLEDQRASSSGYSLSVGLFNCESFPGLDIAEVSLRIVAPTAAFPKEFPTIGFVQRPLYRWGPVTGGISISNPPSYVPLPLSGQLGSSSLVNTRNNSIFETKFVISKPLKSSRTVTLQRTVFESSVGPKTLSNFGKGTSIQVVCPAESDEPLEKAVQRYLKVRVPLQGGKTVIVPTSKVLTCILSRGKLCRI